MPKGNAAILYVEEAYNINRADLMGRHSAGAGFLRGFARHVQAEQVWCYTYTRPQVEAFAGFLSSHGPRRPVGWIDPVRLHQLAEPGCLHTADPNLGPLAWARSFIGSRAYSLTGITHTICSTGVMDAVGELGIAPLESWDALICTSTVARRVIEGVLEQWGAYLAGRLGATRLPRPQLPVIPLGVDGAAFQPADRDRRRTAFRRRFALAEDEIAALFLGRLSFHGKAHPLPMMTGLERAARQSGLKFALLLCGRYPNDGIRAAFRDAAQMLCPNVRLIEVDGTDMELSYDAWFGADLFTSLSDNIQETFGLTPIEAMAAGLPVVVSDWDGYRDTVAHGETGFRLPTVAAPPGSGEVLIRHLAAKAISYDRYIGFASLGTAVDEAAAAEAYIALGRDPGLRRRMGEAGRARVAAHYDWSVIIPSYQELWGELAARRERDASAVPETPRHPLREDPFRAFACFPSRVLDDAVVLAAADTSHSLDALLALEANRFGSGLMCNRALAEEVLARLAADGPAATADLVATAADPAMARRSLAFLLKLGLIRVA